MDLNGTLNFCSQGQDWTLNLSFIIWVDDSYAHFIWIQIMLVSVEGVKCIHCRREKGLVACTLFRPTVCMCVSIWQQAKDSIACRCIVAWRQWQYLRVKCMKQTFLCSAVDHWVSADRSWCLWHHWGPDVYISIPEPRQSRSKPAAAPHARLWSCLWMQQPCDSPQDREAYWSRAEWVFLG